MSIERGKVMELTDKTLHRIIETMKEQGKSDKEIVEFLLTLVEPKK